MILWYSLAIPSGQFLSSECEQAGRPVSILKTPQVVMEREECYEKKRFKNNNIAAIEWFHNSPIKLFSFLGIGTNHINYIYYDYDCLAIYKNSTPDTEGAQWKPVIMCGCQTFWAGSKACWVGVHGLVLPIFLPGQGGGSVATGYLPHVGSLSSVDLRETKLHLLTLLGYWQA